MSADWVTDAACSDLDAESFFPPNGAAPPYLPCTRCPVRPQCLDWAMENEGDAKDHRARFGIFGGLTATDRANPRKVRAARAGGVVMHPDNEAEYGRADICPCSNDGHLETT